MQTRDQKYAEDVYKRVTDIKQTQDRDLATSYGSLAHKLPILIHTAGLAQALAFVASRGKEGSEQLLTDLSKTVLNPTASANDFLARSRESSLREYIHLTKQTLAALLWYKRYAQSVLDVQEDTGRGE